MHYVVVIDDVLKSPIFKKGPGLQNRNNRVTVCLLMHDALPSYRNGIPPLNRPIFPVVQASSAWKIRRRLFVNKMRHVATHSQKLHYFFHPSCLCKLSLPCLMGRRSSVNGLGGAGTTQKRRQ